jgi:hypothetical protein
MLLTLSMLGIAVGWSVFGLRKFSHQQFKLLLDFMAIFLACLPLLGIVLLISERRSNWELFVNDSSYRDSIFFQCWAYVVPGCFAILVSLLTRGAKNTARKSIVYACCFFLPIILSWISFKLGLAALYHPRYSLIGWSGAVLFYCTEIGIISISPKQSIRKFAFWICVPALGFALSHNHLLWHVVYQKQWTMPFESPWRESVDYLETFQNKQTVFLFPNLIEDQLLTGPVHLSPQKRQTLANYCSFPLKGIYQVSTANIVPRSSLFRPRFHSTDKRTLLDSGRVVLIIRGNKEVQSDILNEFASFGLEMKIFIRKISEKEFPVRGAPGNFISVWKFEVKAEPL